MKINILFCLIVSFFAPVYGMIENKTNQEKITLIIFPDENQNTDLLKKIEKQETQNGIIAAIKKIYSEELSSCGSGKELPKSSVYAKNITELESIDKNKKIELRIFYKGELKEGSFNMILIQNNTIQSNKKIFINTSDFSQWMWALIGKIYAGFFGTIFSGVSILFILNILNYWLKLTTKK